LLMAISAGLERMTRVRVEAQTARLEFEG
jgi:hypothetical protein